MEILESKELFENDEIVIVKSIVSEDGFKFANIDVCAKDADGDITQSVTVDCRIIDL